MEPHSRNSITKNRPTFLELGEKYAAGFIGGGLTELSIVKFQSMREVLYECYKILVKRGLTEIEKLTTDEKNNLWNECKKFCEPLSSEDRIKFTKAYWALCSLMQNKV